MCCFVSKCIIVCCIALQCIAVHCSTLQCVAVCCSALQCITVRYSVLQHVTVCWNLLQGVAVKVGVSQCVAVCCSLCVAVCFCVSQCVTVSCIRLQLVKVRSWPNITVCRQRQIWSQDSDICHGACKDSEVTNWWAMCINHETFDWVMSFIWLSRVTFLKELWFGMLFVSFFQGEAVFSW